MKLTVLVDNNTYIDEYYLGEPAVSYFIEDGNTKFLFDIGYSEIFLRNAEAMGIDLEEINSIVISHGHDDHTRGLKYYFESIKPKQKLSIVAHPNAFNPKLIDVKNIGSPFSSEKLDKNNNLILTKIPYPISENIVFLGEIPVTNDFEQRYSMGKTSINGELIEDNLLDDTALVYKTSRGIYIITGCSHSGICNIINYAKKVAEDNRVLGVIGGFHLFEVNDRVYKTIEYFKENNITELYPSHCTSFAVKAEIHKVIEIKEVGVGMVLNW